MTQINWGVLCCFNTQSAKRCHAERNTVFLEIISYPFAFKKLYSKAFFVWKKWLLREDRHTSHLRTTVSDESTDGSLIIEGIIPDILKLIVKWWLKLFKNINHSLSAMKARSSSCWGSSFLPWLLPLLAANMTAFSADRELEKADGDRCEGPNWQRLRPMGKSGEVAISDGEPGLGMTRGLPPDDGRLLPPMGWKRRMASFTGFFLETRRGKVMLVTAGPEHRFTDVIQVKAAWESDDDTLFCVQEQMSNYCLRYWIIMTPKAKIGICEYKNIVLKLKYCYLAT